MCVWNYILYFGGDFPGKFNYIQRARSEVDEQNISLHRQVCLVVVATGEIRAVRLHCALSLSGAEWL